MKIKGKNVFLYLRLSLSLFYALFLSVFISLFVFLSHFLSFSLSHRRKRRNETTAKAWKIFIQLGTTNKKVEWVGGKKSKQDDIRDTTIASNEKEKNGRVRESACVRKGESKRERERGNDLVFRSSAWVPFYFLDQNLWRQTIPPPQPSSSPSSFSSKASNGKTKFMLHSSLRSWHYSIQIEIQLRPFVLIKYIIIFCLKAPLILQIVSIKCSHAANNALLSQGL